MQSDGDGSERAVASITSQILAMGYAKACVEQAIAAVGVLDIEPLVLWLLDNEVQEPKEKAISDPNLKSRETTSSTSSSSSDTDAVCHVVFVYFLCGCCICDVVTYILCICMLYRAIATTPRGFWKCQSSCRHWRKRRRTVPLTTRCVEF